MARALQKKEDLYDAVFSKLRNGWTTCGKRSYALNKSTERNTLMPTWLFEVLFFGSVIGVIAWSIFKRFAVFTAAGNVYEAVTRKPTSPAPVDTPEEMADCGGPRQSHARPRRKRPAWLTTTERPCPDRRDARLRAIPGERRSPSQTCRARAVERRSPSEARKARIKLIERLPDIDVAIERIDRPSRQASRASFSRSRPP